MKEIVLSGGEIAYVDDRDFDRVSKNRWHLQLRIKDKKQYVCRTHRRKGEGRRTRTLFLHRFILGLTNKAETVDHIDGDGLNNCRSNLRICSQADNMKNTKMHSGTKSGFKGVAESSVCPGKWVASINADRITRYLGIFESKKEAAIAYNNAARKWHGEYAHLNNAT